MKKVIYLLTLIISVPSFIAAQDVNRRVADPETGRSILVGYCDREALEMDKFGELFDEYYKLYDPDGEVISKLKQYRDAFDLVIVLGSWCSDSHEQVPRFFKVLDKMKYDQERIEMICVDRNKTGGELDISEYHILYVPTFIIYLNGKEMGRIVESPVRTLEQDLLGILED
jgi:hypothetical protein